MPAATPGNPTLVDFTMPNGQVRNAIVSVTSNYDPAKPLPVLFAFGGWGDSPENFRNYARLGTTPAAREAIVVYPRAIQNAWEGAPYAVTQRGGDVEFVRLIVEELGAHFNIDRNRIYAMGMSNGGGFAVNLACQAPDLLAGVASISGAFYNPVNEGCAPLPPEAAGVPTFILHGAADNLTRFDGGLLHNAPYLPVPVLHRSIADRNKCGPERIDRALRNTLTETTFANCAEETILWRAESLGHDWWYDPDVANAAWSFLARQSR